MREIMKLGIILLVITTVAAAILGYTNAVTTEPIANQVLQANILARQSVLPEATNFEAVSDDVFDGYDGVLEVHKGTNGSELVGYTVKTTSGGYGGPIEIMVGIDNNGVIQGVSVGNHTETPGLGAKATDENFKGQYKGKEAASDLVVIKSGVPKDNEIQAIAGATISSRAVTNGVNMATKLFNEKLK